MVLGGIGWSVIVDIYKRKRFTRFSLDTKMIITTSIFLWVIGSLTFFLSEYTNANTIGPLSVSNKGFHSLFESVSGRTAGFSSVDFSQVKDLTKLFFIGLMFIGGGAGSVAGGIKVGTFAVIVVAVISSIRGRLHVEAFGREIPHFQVHRALAIVILGAGLIFVMSLILTLTEPPDKFHFLDLLFETVSAFATVGLSTGITGELSQLGRVIIILTMFLGRVGPLTLALILAQREEAAPYRYAEERIKIG